MSAVFAAFGIDWRLLIINGVNFALLLLALWYFLYAPLTNLLEARRQKVAQGVRDADEAARALREIEGSRSHILAEAGQAADEVVVKARAAAAHKERELLAASEAAAATLLREAQLEAKELKTQAIEESRREVAKLIVLGMEKTALQK